MKLCGTVRLLIRESERSAFDSAVMENAIKLQKTEASRADLPVAREQHPETQRPAPTVVVTKPDNPARSPAKPTRRKKRQAPLPPSLRTPASGAGGRQEVMQRLRQYHEQQQEKGEEREISREDAAALREVIVNTERRYRLSHAPLTARAADDLTTTTTSSASSSLARTSRLSKSVNDVTCTGKRADGPHVVVVEINDDMRDVTASEKSPKHVTFGTEKEVMTLAEEVISPSESFDAPFNENRTSMSPLTSYPLQSDDTVRSAAAEDNAHPLSHNIDSTSSLSNDVTAPNYRQQPDNRMTVLPPDTATVSQESDDLQMLTRDAAPRLPSSPPPANKPSPLPLAAVLVRSLEAGVGERALRSRRRVESESEKVAGGDATAAPQSDHEHSHLITQVTSALGFLDALDDDGDDVTRASKQIQVEPTSNGHESGERTSCELRRPPPQFIAPPPPSDPPPPLSSSEDDASSTCSECCHLQTYSNAPTPSKVSHPDADEDAKQSIAIESVSNSKTEDFTAQSWLYRNVLQKQAEARESSDALATRDAQRSEEGSEDGKNLTVAEFFKNSRLLAKSHFMKPDAVTCSRRTVEVGKEQKILGEHQLSVSVPFNKYQCHFMCVVYL